jgi:hypothetical protein
MLAYIPYMDPMGKLSGLATESFGHRYWLFRIWHDSQDTHFDAHKQALKK